MSLQEIPINAARVCDGLSKIGYTPATALADLMDNSVQAKASKITLKIIREAKKADSARNNVKEYIIIDNGLGMSQNSILKSLELGASDAHYPGDSLSKFGLGLKSASFSQGEILDVISRDDKSVPFIKYQVSLPLIRKENKYLVDNPQLDNDDIELAETYLKESTGTIVRIREVRKINHPPIKRTVDALQEKVGVIYYYFMKNNKLEIEIDDKLIDSVDPLFIEEANVNGELDEQDWDGKTVRWIQYPIEIVLDAENQVKATLEVTNLVHPPTFKLNGGGESARIAARDKYKISGANHGFYVYRNNRLISWGERFDGMISSDQDYYAFRGRIILDSTADEVVNIDVKKSRIQLSDEAYDVIDNLVADYRRKSRLAWNRAKSIVEDLPKEDVRNTSNEIAASTNFPDELPGEPDDEDSVLEKNKREDEINEKLIRKANTDLDNELSESPDSPTDNTQDKEVPQEGSTPKFIELVDRTTENHLWEMYLHARLGTQVRINKHHRFSKLIYDTLSENKSLSIIMDNLFFTLVQAEKHTLKTYKDVKLEVVEEIMNTFKEIATQYLTKTAQSIDKQIDTIE